MRVDGAAPRGLWPPDGGRLCRRVVKGKVLRIDRPDGRRVLKFDGAFGPEGCGIALSGDEYEVSVTDSPFCVIWHEKHSVDWLAALAAPYPASPDFPLFRGQNKSLYAFL